MNTGEKREKLEFVISISEEQYGALEHLRDDFERSGLEGVEVETEAKPADVKGDAEVIFLVVIAVTELARHLLPQVIGLIRAWSDRPGNPELTLRETGADGTTRSTSIKAKDLHGDAFASIVSSFFENSRKKR